MYLVFSRNFDLGQSIQVHFCVISDYSSWFMEFWGRWFLILCDSLLYEGGLGIKKLYSLLIYQFFILYVHIEVSNAFKTVHFHRSLCKSAGQRHDFIILLIKQLFSVLCICLYIFFNHPKFNEAQQWMCLLSIKLLNWVTWY